MAVLARSESWTITSDYEEVYAHRLDGFRVCVSDHYGDPTCALIAPDESWVAVGGEGVVIYFLRPPFTAYSRGTTDEQWGDALRQQPTVHFIEAIYQNLELEEDVVRVVVDLNDLEKRGIYAISLADMSVEKLLPEPPDDSDSGE